MGSDGPLSTSERRSLRPFGRGRPWARPASVASGVGAAVAGGPPAAGVGREVHRRRSRRPPPTDSRGRRAPGPAPARPPQGRPVAGTTVLAPPGAARPQPPPAARRSAASFARRARTQYLKGTGEEMVRVRERPGGAAPIADGAEAPPPRRPLPTRGKPGSRRAQESGLLRVRNGRHEYPVPPLPPPVAVDGPRRPGGLPAAAAHEAVKAPGPAVGRAPGRGVGPRRRRNLWARSSLVPSPHPRPGSYPRTVPTVPLRPWVRSVGRPTVRVPTRRRRVLSKPCTKHMPN